VKRIHLLVGVMLALGVVLGLVGSRMSSAQDGLKSGTVLTGWEAILMQREVPTGAESGKHTQGGNEIVYIQEGSVTLKVQGKPAVNLEGR